MHSGGNLSAAILFFVFSVPFLSRSATVKNKFHHPWAKIRHDSDHHFPRVAAVNRRSGVAKTPVVPQAQPGGRPSTSHRLSPSAQKDRTWPATRLFSRRDSSPVASALYHFRANCSLDSMSSQSLVIVQDYDCVVFPVAVLSGLPTSATWFFPQCSISGPSPFVAARRRHNLWCDRMLPTFLISRVQQLRLTRM
jgi:hypothetical protein